MSFLLLLSPDCFSLFDSNRGLKTDKNFPNLIVQLHSLTQCVWISSASMERPEWVDRAMTKRYHWKVWLSRFCAAKPTQTHIQRLKRDLFLSSSLHFPSITRRRTFIVHHLSANYRCGAISCVSYEEYTQQADFASEEQSQINQIGQCWVE